MNLVFDLDGTLTDPRSKMSLDFKTLFSKAVDRGMSVYIATGSDIDYVKEQCPDILDLDINYYCCNGAKQYKLLNGEISLYKEKSITDVISEKSLEKILLLIKNKQRIFEKEYKNITSNFIDKRGSMINWCPIGRDSNDKFRKYFVAFDKKNNYRDRVVKYFKQMFISDRSLKNMTIKKGGQTSFDIYPKGWDKSQIFKDIDRNKTIFWGDKCDQDGNDWEIYSLLHESRRHFVSSPQETFDILEKML